MENSKQIWVSPQEHLRANAPDQPVFYFSPSALRDKVADFTGGFPGKVTFAVKANPDGAVIANLAGSGIAELDVASPVEIDLIRRCMPGAALNYNNPVRSVAEIKHAVAAGVSSYSVDCAGELGKLVGQLRGKQVEISVRFKLPVAGAVYDFGSKFGAEPDVAIELLRDVAKLGFVPSLTFHPGTQCGDPQAWDSYIRMAAEIAGQSGVKIRRLNVGGGFPSHRIVGDGPDLASIFATIGGVTKECFGANVPELLCEPGRGLVADAYSVAVRVKAIRGDGSVFLNDGIYGCFAENPAIAKTTCHPVSRYDQPNPADPELIWSAPLAAISATGEFCHLIAMFTSFI